MTTKRFCTPTHMFRWGLLLMPVLLVPMLLVAGGARAGETDPRVRLLFTGDVMGDFEPCDCKDQPLGGLAQRAFVIGEHRGQPVPALVLDAGNLLFRNAIALGADAEMYRKVAALLLMDAYTLIGFDAVNVGARDLVFGLEYLQRLEQRIDFPLLSTNLMNPETGRPVLTSSLTVNRDGTQVVILGVLPGGLEGAGYVTTDPVEAVAAAAERAREDGAELVVLLSTLGQDDEKVLARKVPELDLILGCGDRTRTDPPPLVKGVPLVHPGTRGKYVVEVGYHPEESVRTRFSTTFHPVERGAPVNEQIQALVEETLMRYQSPDFIEAGSKSIP